MGLLDKFKKKTTDTDLIENTANDTVVQPVETNTNGADATASEKIVNGGRRFTLMVEDTLQQPDNNGTVVVGNLHGQVAVEDTVYIIHPNGRFTMSVINGIEIDNGVDAQTAENQQVTIRLTDIIDKSLIQKYTVLTSIRPQTEVDAEQPIENGQLLGLSMEFKRFNQDSEYMTLLVYVACHARFITPVYVSKEAENNEDGAAAFIGGSDFGFLSLAHPSDPAKRHLPIFTDWLAMRKWEEYFNKEHSPKIVMLRFPDVVSIVKKDISGAVINPYGPVPVLLTNDYIEKITSLEGYKTEFGNKKKQDARQVQAKEDEQILVSVPAENEEVKCIREAILEVVKPNADINRVYMLLKTDNSGNKSYFLIVDCDKETEKNSINQIALAVKPYLNQISRLDMISYEQFGGRIRNMRDKGLVFNRASFWK